MLYISTEDFYQKVSACRALTRQEEKDCYQKMWQGDDSARQRLVESYLPLVAGHVKHHAGQLGLILYYQQALEKAVDSFNFLQDSEPFSHRLSWALRQAYVKYLVRNSK